MTQLLPYIARDALNSKRYIEPFIGGGSMFFAIAPPKAILSDINRELIIVYKGIQKSPKKVWKAYQSFPDTKEAYYEIRDESNDESKIIKASARMLYLNRTCFKGMWRHNAAGQFNVGYGGQQRRGVISYDTLLQSSLLLRDAKLKCGDFAPLIDGSEKGDFIFCDPPYKPAEVESVHSHYVHAQFTIADHQRLAEALNRATHRGVKWAITTTSHKNVTCMFKGESIFNFITGTGVIPGVITEQTGEVLICNY